MTFFLSHVLPEEFRVLISVATFLSRAGMTLLSLTMESLCDIKHLLGRFWLMSTDDMYLSS